MTFEWREVETKSGLLDPAKQRCCGKVLWMRIHMTCWLEKQL